MWYLKNIPKVLFLYWGRNKPLSLLRYTTIISFIRLNPDWKVIVFYPKHISYEETWRGNEQKANFYKGKDYFDELTNIIYTKEVDFNLTEKDGKDPRNMPEVFKSDMLRIYLLSKHGGVWSDFDIVFLKPMKDLYINTEEYSNTGSVICYHNKYSFAGFLMSKKGSIVYTDMINNKYYINIYSYTSILDCVYSDMFSKLDFLSKVSNDSIACKNTVYKGELVVNLAIDTVYPIRWGDTDKLVSDNKILLSDNTIGIHWYAGSNRLSQHEMGGLCQCNGFICSKVREIYEI